LGRAKFVSLPHREPPGGGGTISLNLLFLFLSPQMEDGE
jgi:hypothetical protein